MSIISKYKADAHIIIFLLINSPPKTEDYQKCIDYWIENTYLPLSVIVIGIGNEELEEVKKFFLIQNCNSLLKDVKKVEIIYILFLWKIAIIIVIF